MALWRNCAASKASVPKLGSDSEKKYSPNLEEVYTRVMLGTVTIPSMRQGISRGWLRVYIILIQSLIKIVRSKTNIQVAICTLVISNTP